MRKAGAASHVGHTQPAHWPDSQLGPSAFAPIGEELKLKACRSSPWAYLSFLCGRMTVGFYSGRLSPEREGSHPSQRRAGRDRKLSFFKAPQPPSPLPCMWTVICLFACQKKIHSCGLGFFFLSPGNFVGDMEQTLVSFLGGTRSRFKAQRRFFS